MTTTSAIVFEESVTVDEGEIEEYVESSREREDVDEADFSIEDDVVRMEFTLSSVSDII